MKKLFIFLLLFLSIVQFIYRGPLRSLKSSDDFSIIYISAKRWVQRENPYNHDEYFKTWVESGGNPLKMPSTVLRPSLYPITIMPFVAAVTFFPWNKAKKIWLIINLLSFSMAIFLLNKLFNIELKSSKNVFILVSLLILSPLNDGITQGNPVILSTSFFIFSIFYYFKNLFKKSGLCLGISCAIKPQIAFPLIFYYIIKKEYYVIKYYFATLSIIFIVSIVIAGNEMTSWILNYYDNLNTAFGYKGANDPCNSISRHSIISIDYLFCAFKNQKMVYLQTIKYLVFIILSVALYNISKYKSQLEFNFYIIIFLNLLFILTFYHRNPDGLILIFIIYSLIVNLNKNNYNKKYFLIIYFIFMIIFISGGPVHLDKLVQRGIVPELISQTIVWNIIIMPFKQWGLIIMLIVILLLLYKYKSLK